MTIERVSHNALLDGVKPTCSIEIRSLFLNLKDKGNPAIRNEITLGVLSTDKLVNMSKDVSQRAEWNAAFRFELQRSLLAC